MHFGTETRGLNSEGDVISSGLYNGMIEISKQASGGYSPSVRFSLERMDMTKYFFCPI